MKDVKKIWEIQQLEEKIAQIEQDTGIDQLRIQMNENRKGYATLNEKMQSILADYRQKKDLYEKAKDQIQKIEEKLLSEEELLYEGNVTKVKAIYTLEKDMEDQKMQREHYIAECKKLTHYLTSDKNNLVKLKEKLNEIKSKSDLLAKELAKKEQEEAGRIDEIYAQIKKIEAGTDADDVKEYREKKKNISPVVASVEEGICSGCKMQLSLVFCQDIKDGIEKELRCENCGRDLYLP